MVCVPMPAEFLDRLQIPLMTQTNDECHQTAFTVSVDVKHSEMTTGISAADRSRTVHALHAPESQPHHFARPGHVLPLRARPGGVLERPGHTEAAVGTLFNTCAVGG